MLKEQKKALRAEMRLRLKQYDKTAKEKSDRNIFQKLLQHPWIQEAEGIYCYYSMPQEVDTIAFMKEMLRQGKKIALPVCENQNGQMHFSQIETLSSDEIIPQVWEIPAPVRDHPADFKKAVILVPGLAFTADGCRLGQGGGYYDRYLHQLPAEFRTIGICYDFMLLETLPCEIHDCHVHQVITD